MALSKEAVDEYTLYATLAVGLIAAMIAWRQVSVAKKTLNFELFERREKVYLAAKKLIESVVDRQEKDWQHVFDYREAIQPGRWLLDQACWAYLEKLDERAANILVHRQIMDWPLDMNSSEADKQQQMYSIHTRSALLAWFHAQTAELPLVFAHQLTLQQHWFFPTWQSKWRLRKQRQVTLAKVLELTYRGVGSRQATESWRWLFWIKNLLRKLRLR